MPRTNLVLSRRQMLRGTSVGLGLGLPFLSSLMARAETGDLPPPRVIFFFTGNEPIKRDYWKPPGTGSAFDLTSLPAIMQPLAVHKDRLLMIGDLQMTSRLNDPKAGGHIGISHLLVGRKVTVTGSKEGSCFGSGISLDHFIAKQRGTDALTLGVMPGGNSGVQRMSYLGDSQPVNPISRPTTAFENLFGDVDLTPDELAIRRQQSLSVLDRVSGDLVRLKASLPAEGRQKLDVHAEMVRQLELNLAADVSACTVDGPPQGIDYLANANFPVTARRQMDVMLQALGCGLTDVASIQLGDSGSPHITPVWPGEGLNIDRDYHTIAHQYESKPNDATIKSNREKTETFLYSLFAYLLEKMESIPEGDGTMLDNSLVVWCKPLGRKHYVEDLLFMLAGGAGGQLETGRFVSYPGRSHNDLLVSIMNLMGIDGEVFGDPAFCTGPLPLV